MCVHKEHSTSLLPTKHDSRVSTSESVARRLFPPRHLFSVCTKPAGASRPCLTDSDASASGVNSPARLTVVAPHWDKAHPPVACLMGSRGGQTSPPVCRFGCCLHGSCSRAAGAAHGWCLHVLHKAQTFNNQHSTTVKFTYFDLHRWEISKISQNYSTTRSEHTNDAWDDHLQLSTCFSILKSWTMQGRSGACLRWTYFQYSWRQRFTTHALTEQTRNAD